MARFKLSEGTVLIGRESPDIKLLPSHPSLSRRHFSVSVKGGKLSVRDLKSANGSFLKIDKRIRIADGDQISIGRQLLRFTTKREIPDRRRALRLLPVHSRMAARTTTLASAPSEGLAVTFENSGQTCALKEGQSICELAEQEGIRLSASAMKESAEATPSKSSPGRRT